MLKLRPYAARDAKTIVSWLGDEVSFRKWCSDRYDKYPITADDMNGYYETYADADGFHVMTAFDDTGVVGHMTIRFTDEEKTAARFGFVIVDNKKRGMGYGKQMLEAAIEYTFGTLKAEKITLGVFENNPSAHMCYRSVGFREVASKYRIFRILGEDWKCVEMEMTKQERT